MARADDYGGARQSKRVQAMHKSEKVLWSRVIGRGCYECGEFHRRAELCRRQWNREKGEDGCGAGSYRQGNTRQAVGEASQGEREHRCSRRGPGAPVAFLTVRHLASVAHTHTTSGRRTGTASLANGTSNGLALPPPARLLLTLLFLAALLVPPPSKATAAPAEVIRLRTRGKAGAAACAAPPPDTAVYDRPVIGIVSHPGDSAGGRISNTTATSYIAASYVKFVEAGSARVIPIIYNEPEERLLEKLSLVNGVLFTGGSAKRGLYFETIKKVFRYVLDKNDAGEQFPLFAQCLGFELVSMIVSKDNNILEKFDALNQTSTLQFPSYDFEGSVFQRFDPELIKKVSTSCLVMQQHKYAISPRRLQENDALSSFFKILTTSPDENGKVHVSTVQAHKYPITCTQWHPEKAIFEWRNPVIPHSEDAVQVTQHFANHFISQARKSPNRPPPDKVLDNLIYNYSPTGKNLKSFEEVYVFS